MADDLLACAGNGFQVCQDGFYYILTCGEGMGYKEETGTQTALLEVSPDLKASHLPHPCGRGIAPEAGPLPQGSTQGLCGWKT